MSFVYQAINVQPSIAQGFYSDTLYKASSIANGVVTVYPNIKNSQKITSLNTASGLQVYSCAWSPDGDLDADGILLSTCKLKINKEICKDEIEQTYLSQLMRPGTGAEIPSNILQFWIDRTLEATSFDIERIMWAGDTTSLDPILKLCNGYMKKLADATGTAREVIEGTIVAMTAANLVAQLIVAYNLIPDQLMGNTDLWITLPIGVKKFFQLAINSTVTQVNTLGINIVGDSYTYNNLPINFSAGMPANNIDIAPASQLGFGTDLLSDIQAIEADKVDKFSDNYGLKAVMIVGMQFLNPNEIVWAHI